MQCGRVVSRQSAQTLALAGLGWVGYRGQWPGPRPIHNIRGRRSLSSTSHLLTRAVLSFMSQFSAGTKTPPRTSSPPDDFPRDSPYSHRKTVSATEPFPDHHFDRRPITPPDYGTPVNGSPINSPPRQRSNSRPLSIVQTHQPPLMDINEDTIPELQPIFSFLNTHSNKLYQEGYFLKLDDQNTRKLSPSCALDLAPRC